MAAAMEQLVPAPPPVIIHDPLAAFPYDARDQLETFLYEEQQEHDPQGRPPQRAWIPPDEMAAAVHHVPSHDIREFDEREPQGNWSRQQHVREAVREPPGYRSPVYSPRKRYISEESVGYRSQERDEREFPIYRGEEKREYQDQRPRRRYKSEEEEEEPQDYRSRQQPSGKYNERESEGYTPRHERGRPLVREDYGSRHQHKSVSKEPEGYRSRSQRSSETKEDPQRYKPHQKRKSKEKSRSRRRHSKKMDSSSSRSSSFSGSGSLTSSWKGMPPSPLQQRAPSPKVAFVMRKDDDMHYSKVYTRAAFRDYDDDQPTSVKGSREGGYRFKGSEDKISLSSISSDEESQVSPKRSRHHSISEDDNRHRRPRHRPKEHHSASRRFQHRHNWTQNRQPTTDYQRPYGGGRSYHRRPPFNIQRGKRAGGVLINLVQSPNRLKKAEGERSRVPEHESSGEAMVINHVPVLESKWDRLETEEEPVISRIPNIKSSKTGQLEKVDDQLSNSTKRNSPALPAKVVKPNDPPPAWTLKGTDNVSTVKKRKDSFGAIKAATERIRKAHVRKATTAAKKVGPIVMPFTWKT